MSLLFVLRAVTLGALYPRLVAEVRA